MNKIFNIDFLVRAKDERKFLEEIERIIENGFAIKSEVILNENE